MAAELAEGDYADSMGAWLDELRAVEEAARAERLRLIVEQEARDNAVPLHQRDSTTLRSAAKQLQQQEPGATRPGPTSTSRAPRATQRMTTHTIRAQPPAPRLLALLRLRDHGALGWRPLRFTTRPSSRPPTRRSMAGAHRTRTPDAG